MYNNKFNPNNNLQNNCSPVPSSPAQFFPDNFGCQDCSSQNVDCNCTLSDITYNQDATPCMVSLGIARNMPLAMVLQIYGSAICNLQGDLTCADVAIPGTFLNTGYVGTQFTATWTNPDFIDYPEQFGITIDGVFYNIGVVVNSYYLLLGFNALGKGVFTLNGNTLTAVGFHTYGVVLFAGGDDGQSIPVITGSTTYQSLCDYANAVDDEFGEVNTILASLQTQITASKTIVLYANANPITQSAGATGNLHGFNVPAGTLVKNGDTLLIDFAISVPVIAGGNSTVRLYLPFGSANYIQLGGTITPSILGSIKLVRISDTTVLLYGTSHAGLITGVTATGYAVPTNGSVTYNPNSTGGPLVVLSLSANSFQIQLEVTTSAGATISSTFLTVAKLSA